MSKSALQLRWFNDALSVFISGLSEAQSHWRGITSRSDGKLDASEFHRHLRDASDARERITKLAPSVVHSISPPSNKNAVQFVAGILNDVESAWHLCRFMHSIKPTKAEHDPDFKRIQNEMHQRVPALRNSLWEAWRHIRYTVELAASQPTKNDNGPKKPSWKRELGKLLYDGREIKSVRSVTVAKNVAKILDVFEEEGWPTRIDDPLDQSKDQQRMHEAIRRLNDNLSSIRFHADGTGEGIVWELTAQEPHGN